MTWTCAASESGDFCGRRVHEDYLGVTRLVPLCGNHLERLTRLFQAHEQDLTRAVSQPETADVYFLQRSDGRVKIGWSKNVSVRKKDLEVAAGPLRLLWREPGGLKREQKLHRWFAASRVHNEWFEPDPDVLAYVDGQKRLAKSPA